MDSHERPGETGVLPSIFVVAFILLVFVGLSPLSGASETYDGELLGAGDAIRQVAFLGVFVGLLFLNLHRRREPPFFSVPVPLLLLVAWCWLSVA